MKTLLKVKFQVFTIQLVSLLERNFALLSWNFWSNCSSKFLLVAGSERLDSKASPSKTSKTSKDQKKLFVSGLQNGCSEDVQGKCWNRASATLTCNVIVTELHHEHFLRNVPTYFEKNIS